jgi:hypothetical protein
VVGASCEAGPVGFAEVSFFVLGDRSLLLEMVRDCRGESLQSLIAFAQRSVDGGGEVSWR